MTTEMVRSDGEVVDVNALMPIMSVEQMMQRHSIIVNLTRKVMRDGHDYGVIPGTGQAGKEPVKTLLKPGSEKLCTLFGLTPDFQEDKVVLDFERGLFLFSYRCILLRGASQEVMGGKPVITGTVVGTAIGSANSREKKYARIARVCPQCGKPAIIKGKEEYGGGYVCFKKKDGCGAKFKDDDASITQQTGVTSPDDAADQINTLQKMACKRALIAAVLIATNASEFFTQDLEDMADHAVEPPKRPDPTKQVTQPPEDLTAVSAALEQYKTWLDSDPNLTEINAKMLPGIRSIADKKVRSNVWPYVKDRLAQAGCIFDEKAKVFIVSPNAPTEQQAWEVF